MLQALLKEQAVKLEQLKQEARVLMTAACKALNIEKVDKIPKNLQEVHTTNSSLIFCCAFVSGGLWFAAVLIKNSIVFGCLLNCKHQQSSLEVCLLCSNLMRCPPPSQILILTFILNRPELTCLAKSELRYVHTLFCLNPVVVWG